MLGIHYSKIYNILHPSSTEGGSAETWPTLALYTDNNVHMGDADNAATAKLYGE